MTDLRQSAPANVAFIPPQINTLEDTGLPSLWLQDLVLKVLYFRGYMTGFKVAEEIALPMAGVTDQLLTALKLEKFIEVKSSQGGLGEGAYTYGITTAGTLRAREALERSQYAGQAPVPFEVYNEIDSTPEKRAAFGYHAHHATNPFAVGNFRDHFSAVGTGA